MNISPDHIIALSSVFIALSAFILSFRQARSTEKHNRLSLTPHLCITTLYDQENVHLVADLENTGIGPAILKECLITIDGTEIKELPVDWIQIFDNFKFPGTVAGMNLGMDEFIQPGKKYLLLGLESVDKEMTKKDMAKLTQRVKILIKYESVYGEKKETLFNGLADG